MKKIVLSIGLILVLCLGIVLNSCEKDKDKGTATITGSWTKAGGDILTFYNTGAVTTNNLGTGTYGNGTINLSVPMGNSGTGSYNLSGTKLIISGFVRVGATTFDRLNGEWLKME
jgi:hypothetical protein